MTAATTGAAVPCCANCGMDAVEATFVRTADPSVFDGLNMAGGMPDAICCEVTV